MLMKKLEKAADELNITQVGIAGGVSANSGLRAALVETGERKGWNIFIPKFEYCTDNAAMIGITGYFKYLNGDFSALNVSPSARATW
jgi:N6-L-threonylcarbamoyladenine synthase